MFVSGAMVLDQEGMCVNKLVNRKFETSTDLDS
jgi:hypothetical protein